MNELDTAHFALDSPIQHLLLLKMSTCLKRLFSHLFVIPEARFHSERSGEMDLRWERGRLVLNSPEANYSYNSLHLVFRKALSHVDKEKLGDRPILNLGMGAGSTVNIIRNELRWENPVLSVEQDQAIIEVAERYFAIAEYAQHEIIHADAFDFLEVDQGRYGLVLIDLFIDKDVDERFLGARFADMIATHLMPNSQVVFNFIGEGPHPILPYLDKRYQHKTLKIGENRVLIYSNTEIS